MNDGLKNEVLRKSSMCFGKKLCFAFNIIGNKYVFPTAWKTAPVFLIQKDEGKQWFDWYRGIPLFRIVLTFVRESAVHYSFLKRLFKTISSSSQL